MDLRGKRVLITGASRGIGEATAREVAGRGAIVAAVARSADKLDTLVSDVGGSAHPTDLTDPDAVNGLVERVESEAGPIDVLVNNAGIDSVGGFTEMATEEIEQIFRLNLLTPVHLTQQAVRSMEPRGGGHVVNVSSMAGAAAFGGMTCYGATKAGLTHFTAVLALELNKSNVSTTTVQLGPIPTDMLDHVNDHQPTRDAFDRLYKIQLITDVPKEKVALEIADAIEKGRRFVRLPKRATAFPMASNFPMWFMDKLQWRVKQR